MTPPTSPEPQAPDLRVTPRLVIGLAIMLAGLVLALDSLGFVEGHEIFRFWPLALVAVGVVKWISPPLGFLLVTFGRMSFAGLWALILLFVGANIAFRALRPVASAADPSATLDMVAVLGGAKTVSHAPDFRGGQALATMGGCDIDLRRASIAEGGEAVIDAFAFWGGIEIKVPEDWEVVNRGSAFLGGFENKARPAPGSRKRLVVTGTAIMGGVEVKN